MKLSEKPADLDQASRAVEALVLKQLLVASGAFKIGSGAGSHIHADLFVDTLAQELAKAGGLGFREALLGHLGEQQAVPGNEVGGPVGRFARSGVPGNEVGAPPAPLRPSARAPEAASFDPTELVLGGARVSSGFGTRADPFHGGASHHRGVDVAAAEGSEILAAADGVVRFSGDRGGYGNTVVLDHGGGVTTLYAHASELSVEEGERVLKGQIIGRVGSTGRATGDHLHFEVRVDDRPISPTRALKAYGVGVE